MTTATRIIPVYMLIPPRALLLDVAGPMEVLRRANIEQTAVRFDIRYIAVTPEVLSSVGLRLAGLQPLPDHLPDGALVIISGSVDQILGHQGPGDLDRQHEAEIVAWLGHAIRPGIQLATICSGALLAARAGLLDGHECTTHHTSVSDLARLAPAARVYDNRLFVVDGDRMSSAGVTAGIDLMLALVTAELGHMTALAVARHLVIYLRRAGADPQLSPWLEGRNHVHRAIHRAQDAVGANPAHDWTVESLADIAATSPRNLSRLFNEQTGMSVTDYVNRQRIALARELVVGSRLDMELVAERSGFSSARQFRRVWNRLNTTSPTSLRSLIDG